MIVVVFVSMFDHKPERCPFGHSLWPGRAQVSWQPCLLRPGMGTIRMGHLRVICKTCDDQFWRTTFYEPPHDIKHHQAGPWRAN
jgi:hypothetical protein